MIKVAKRGTEIALYDPFDRWLGLKSRIFFGSPIDNFFEDPFWTEFGNGPVTVEEDGDETVVTAEVLEIPADKLEVSYDKNQRLRIRAEHKEEKEEENRRERSYREIDYRLDLPIDPKKAKATLEDGILTLRAPKGEKVKQTTKIAVEETKRR